MPFNTLLEDGLSVDSTAEEIQAYIDIATEFLTDVLATRGWTAEQWNLFRKGIINSEKEFIQSEISRFETPLPV
jgi:hypothetical protein